MGGRGSSSGGGAASANERALFTGEPARVIESEYREARGGSAAYYTNDVLEAVASDPGVITFGYATPETRDKTAKTNRTQYLTYKLKAGAVNGDSFGINWANVNEIRGQTYSLRQEAKKNGLRFDGTTKSWKRP